MPLQISNHDLAEDRFARFRLIHWWDQERLAKANVLVIGAGALGNEILKNLALLGVRKIGVVDLDRIELSNLSRSVLFRAGDVGQAKAHTAAAAARELMGDGTVHPLHANVLSGIGLGVFAWADVILAGLDNREARLWINRCAWKMNRPWIDGAIEGLQGLARVFLPGRPPCYECTLGEVDWQILERRLSCNLLTREETEGGKTPTTPTTSSVIAGIQTQEAVKLLHGLPVLQSRAFVFEGVHHTSYVTSYTENPDCLSHEVFAEIVELPHRSAELRLDELYAVAREQLASGEPLVLEFSRDVIGQLVCPACGAVEERWSPVGSISAAQGKCPRDGALCEVVAVHAYHGHEPFGARTLLELGLPAFDVFSARAGGRQVHFLLGGDREEVLGPLAEWPRAEVWPEVANRFASEAS